MSRHTIFQNLILALLLLASYSVYADDSTPLSMQTAVDHALQNNPGLAQIQAQAQALATIPSQVGALPDPTLSFNALNLPTDSFDTRQEAMTQMQFGLSQSLPFPGKLALREQAATYDAAAALQNVTEARQWLIRHVKDSWWQIFYLDHALQIIDSNRLLLKQFIQIARTKYEVGEGLQQDVLLAQLELSQLLDRQLQLQNARNNSAVRLNSLLNRPPDTALSLPETAAEPLPELLTKTELYQQAELYRAALAGQRENLQAAQSRLQLAHQDYYPDFTVGAAYSGRDTSMAGAERADFLSFKLTMTLPIFADRKQARAVEQKTRELMARQYALQDAHNNVQAQITQAYNDFQRAKKQFILFDTGIVPQARQTVASMLAGYQVNKVDFLNLVRSQITLFNYETQYWQTFAQAQQALAQLTAAVGRNVTHE